MDNMHALPVLMCSQGRHWTRLSTIHPNRCQVPPYRVTRTREELHERVLVVIDDDSDLPDGPG